MHSSDFHELQSIQAKLDGFDQRCATIMALLDSKKSLSQEECSHAEELYRLLKEDLRNAAKLGTVTNAKRALTDAEQCYYQPAVQSAALAMAPATSSHPIAANWYGALYDAQLELSYYRPGNERTR